MKKLIVLTALLFGGLPIVANAGDPTVANPDHEAMLRSDDPKLAANKRLIYDFWREVVESGHVENGEKYLPEDYVQHNPNVDSGRQQLLDYFSSTRDRSPVEDRVKVGIVHIIAEGDYVSWNLLREFPDPNDPAKTYTTSGPSIFRIENGKIAEHWDAAFMEKRE